jgi:hypothetical protein
MQARKRAPSSLQLQHETNGNGPIIKELHKRPYAWAMQSRINKQREDRGFIIPAPAACSDEAKDKRRRPSA